MALSGSIPHLVNGVSRQVDSMRLPTQSEEQINRFSAPATGNQRRPSTDYVATLTGAFGGEQFYHAINRDETERYHVLIRNGDLAVFDKNGAEKTVAFPNGKAYLNTTTPIASFAAATSADYTFIVNKEVTVAMNNAVRTPDRGSEALVFIRAANYSKRFRIIIDDVIVAEYETTAAVDDSASQVQAKEKTVSPQKIAQALFWGDEVLNSVNGWTGPDGHAEANTLGNVVVERLVDNLDPDDWGVVRYGNVLHIKKVDGTPFALRTESDRDVNGDTIIGIRDVTSKFSDLPNRAPLGYVVRISGLESDQTDDYWVRADKPNNDDDNDTVVWTECPPPDTPLSFDAATMPHVLVRESNGTFTFKRATWDQRRVGGTDEDPSFIGNKINDVLFIRGRTVFLTSESVVMSVPTEFFNFWRTTMQAALDDDPIDVAGTSDNVAIFRHGVSFNEDLYLQSSLTFHRLTAGDLLSPKNVALPQAVTAQCNTLVSPVATAKSILFVGTGKTYGEVREVFIRPDTEEAVNASVSDHVPGYLPTTINRLVVSDAVNMAVAFSLGTGSAVYVYQYYWAGDEKLQAAWHRWEFPAGQEVVGATFFDDELHMLWRQAGTVRIVKMSCSASLFDPGQDWMIRADLRVLSTSLPAPTYDDTFDRTTYVLPYSASVNSVVCRWGGVPHGLSEDVEGVDGSTIYLAGDTRALTLVFGRPFTSTLVPSRFYVREQAGERSTILQTGPFRLRRLFVHLSHTAHMVAKVRTYFGGPEGLRTFAPYTGADAESLQDIIKRKSYAFSVPIKGRSDRVSITFENDTPYPDCITGIEWEGEYDIRAQRT